MAELLGAVYVVDAEGEQLESNWQAPIVIDEVEADNKALYIDIPHPTKKGANIVIQVKHIDLMYALGQVRNVDS